jgi:hypothetical protein
VDPRVRPPWFPATFASRLENGREASGGAASCQKARYEVEGRRNEVRDNIGKHWTTQSLSRYQVLAAKMPRRMHLQRVFASTSSIISDHFNKLVKVIRTKRFRPQEITNVAQKGIILGYSSKSKVITRRGKKIPSRRKNVKRELVTPVKPTSADGYILPTFLITKEWSQTYGQFGTFKKEDADVSFTL